MKKILYNKKIYILLTLIIILLILSQTEKCYFDHVGSNFCLNKLNYYSDICTDEDCGTEGMYLKNPLSKDIHIIFSKDVDGLFSNFKLFPYKYEVKVLNDTLFVLGDDDSAQILTATDYNPKETDYSFEGLYTREHWNLDFYFFKDGTYLQYDRKTKQTSLNNYKVKYYENNMYGLFINYGTDLTMIYDKKNNKTYGLVKKGELDLEKFNIEVFENYNEGNYNFSGVFIMGDDSSSENYRELIIKNNDVILAKDNNVQKTKLRLEYWTGDNIYFSVEYDDYYTLIYNIKNKTISFDSNYYWQSVKERELKIIK